METTPLYTGAFGHPLALFNHAAHGRCAHCAHEGRWDDHGDHLRCRTCGANPLGRAADALPLPAIGDASIVHTWTDPVLETPLAAWCAGLLDTAAAWLNAQADRLRTPSGSHPAPGAA